MNRSITTHNSFKLQVARYAQYLKLVLVNAAVTCFPTMEQQTFLTNKNKSEFHSLTLEGSSLRAAARPFWGRLSTSELLYWSEWLSIMEDAETGYLKSGVLPM